MMMRLPVQMSVNPPFLFGLGVFLIVLWWIGIPLLEKASIYYPTRPFDATPAAVNLPFEEVVFQTQDGVSLTGWWIPVSPQVGRARGTVLFFHGNAGNISHRLEHAAMIHGMGLNLLLIDYRGYGKSQGVPSERGLYADALGARRWLESRKEVDAGRILYYGESLGAAAAIDLALKHPPAALIMEAPFSSVAAMAKRYYPWLPAWLLRSRYDNLSKITRAACPVLIFHSRQDEITPFAHSQQIIEASGSRLKRLIPLSGEHNEAFLLEIRRIVVEMEIFLSEAGLSR